MGIFKKIKKTQKESSELAKTIPVKAEKSIKIKDVKGILDNSYNKKLKWVPEGYTLDQQLSGRRVQVYTGKYGNVIISHRGTQGIHDIGTALKFMISKDWAHKSKRFKHAEKVQKKAQEKYNDQHITTMGHSLGGAIAEQVGKNSDKIITLNKAASHHETNSQRLKNQTDIYSKADIVSAGAHKQKGGHKFVITPTSSNPLSEHKTNILKKQAETFV